MRGVPKKCQPLKFELVMISYVIVLKYVELMIQYAWLYILPSLAHGSELMDHKNKQTLVSAK